MKLKKARNSRRRLSFYRAAYGFKPPFSVLVDGTAVVTSLNLKVSLEDELPKLLGGKVRLLVPKAVVSELRAFGPRFQEAERLACTFRPLEEDAASTQTAAETLLGKVGDGNPDRLMVLTEDGGLQRELARVPGVPLLRFARERLVLEAPTERTCRDAEARELAPARTDAAPSGTPAQGKGSAAGTASARGVGGAKPSIKKKRKLKEPNPLSVKRKQQKGAQGQGVRAGSEVNGSELKRRRKRQRVVARQPAAEE